MLVTVVMVATAGDERHFAVYSFQRAADALPHLPAALIQHVTVQGIILVLLHKIPCAQERLDVEMINVVRHP